MSKPDKRFELSIPFIVEEIKDGEPTPFFECDLRYHDLPYDGVVIIQTLMIGLLEQLNQLGHAAAEEMGLGEKLKGLRPK